MKGYTYILECSDGSFYTGSTINLEKRLVEHSDGKGANHTRKHLPVRLVYREEFLRIDDAFYREKQIQGWSRAKKIALIDNNFEELKKFSECKNNSHYKKWLRLRSTIKNLKNKKSEQSLDSVASTPLSHQQLIADNEQQKCGSAVARNQTVIACSLDSVAERSRMVAERSRMVAERSRSHSNGKLLLTAEYAVLDGAKALAIPTQFGQSLIIQPICENTLHWKSYDNQNRCWFEAQFEPNRLRIISATFDAAKDGGNDMLAETLQKILLKAQQLNPNFLKNDEQFLIETKLDFPRNWGLGSSSTLINNIAKWAKVDAFKLLQQSFGGSGYDIACAQHNSPIFYTLENNLPKIEITDYNPLFKEQLYFVHLNHKQQSKDAIAHYRKQKNTVNLNEISMLTNAFARATSINDLEKIIQEHEMFISHLIKQQPVQKRLFSDYFGSVKSLGAWGGDFVLATGNDDSENYFKKKGFETVIPYSEMILS